jgi:hypothetical protein
MNQQTTFLVHKKGRYWVYLENVFGNLGTPFTHPKKIRLMELQDKPSLSLYLNLRPVRCKERVSKPTLLQP